MSVNIGKQVSSIDLNTATVSQVNQTVNSFISTYAQNTSTPIYEWQAGNLTSFGVISNSNGIVKSYYIAVS